LARVRRIDHDPHRPGHVREIVQVRARRDMDLKQMAQVRVGVSPETASLIE
jgi:DNA-binding XRE family transcriptional regulator